jgi:hypothetical protein
LNKAVAAERLVRAIRDALALVLGLAPRDDAPGHQRRTALIVVGVIAMAFVLVVIVIAVRGTS